MEKIIVKNSRADSSNAELENFVWDFSTKEGKWLCSSLTSEITKHLRPEFSHYKTYNFRLIEMPRSQASAKVKGLGCSFSIAFEFLLVNDLLLASDKDPEKTEEARKIILRLGNGEIERAYLNRIVKQAYAPFENIIGKTLAEFCRSGVVKLGVASFDFNPNIKLIKKTTYSLEFKASLRVEVTFKHLNTAEHQPTSNVKFLVSGNVPSEVLHNVGKKTEERLLKKAGEKLGGQHIEKIEVKFAPNIVNASRGTFYRSNVYAYVAGKATKICEVRICHKQ